VGRGTTGRGGGLGVATIIVALGFMKGSCSGERTRDFNALWSEKEKRKKDFTCHLKVQAKKEVN
jgi:hypothetical protein